MWTFMGELDPSLQISSRTRGGDIREPSGSRVYPSLSWVEQCLPKSHIVFKKTVFADIIRM